MSKSSDTLCCQLCGKNLPNFGLYQQTCELCAVKPRETTIQQDRAERWKRMYPENNGRTLGKLEVINQTYNG